MYTKEQLLQAIPDVPTQFSLAELEEILTRPHPAAPVVPLVAPPRPATQTPEEAAEWDYYTSPETMALYARVAVRYPASANVEHLHGLVQLSEAGKRKTAKEWQAEAIREKYGL